MKYKIHIYRFKFLISQLCCLLPIFHAQAQDPHFSQYFASPLTQNPANTGNFDYTSRSSTNFRSQWMGIGQPFLTGTASYEGHMLKKKMGDRNHLGAGLLGLFDQTTGGLYRGNYLSASVAYHLIMDEDYTEQLSVGFQGTLVNKRLDASRIAFAEQFNGVGFDRSLPSFQTFSNSSIGYLDVNAGILYTKTGENAAFYAGASAYHLRRPRESFLGNRNLYVDIRYTAQVGGAVFLGDFSQIMATVQYMGQGTAYQTMAGMAYGYRLDNQYKDIIFYLGGWYRIGDAIIPYLGYQYDRLQLGLSYDLTMSGLNLSSTRNRSIEVSMIYHFMEKSKAVKMVRCWF